MGTLPGRLGAAYAATFGLKTLGNETMTGHQGQGAATRFGNSQIHIHHSQGRMIRAFDGKTL